MRSTLIAMVGALVLVATVAQRPQADVGAAEPAAAAKPSTKAEGIAALKKLLADSGLKYEWIEESSLARIGFSDIEHASTSNVFVYVADKNGFYIKMLITLIDKPKEHRFSPAMLRAAMKLNGGLWLLRLSFDEAEGDIDASIGFDREGVSPQIFKDYVMHLVNTGDEVAKELKQYLE